MPAIDLSKVLPPSEQDLAAVRGWPGMSLAEQCALPVGKRRVVAWLIVTGALSPSVEYLVSGRPVLGAVAAHVHHTFYERFTGASVDLGYQPSVVRNQWRMAVELAVLAVTTPERLNLRAIERGKAQLMEAFDRHRPASPGMKAVKAGLAFGVHNVLFHMGIVERTPRRQGQDQSQRREQAWAAASPRLAGTLRGYVEQVRVSLRPATVVHVETTLREFAHWLAAGHPEVRCVADLRRRHIEAYKVHLATRRSARGATLSKVSIAEALGVLRACFERLAEWGGEDVPSGVLVFSGDRPLLDEPLPRFLDDGASTKLLQAARADADPFVRLCVEFLARTGLRKGEFLNLRVDSVVQIGSAYWLHVPVGKLRTDRYIPLHPQLKALLDDWLAGRPEQLRSPYLFVQRGQRIGYRRVDLAVTKAARAAGIGHVTPHQLRHTLATQAVNRGMSMEAIAALLGHRSMRMTMVYANPRELHQTGENPQVAC